MVAPQLQLLRPPTPVKPRPVLANRSFLLLWLAQLISQSAQNAILFTLLVLVTSLTDGSTFTSILVLSFVIPSVVFGVFSGVLVDMWSKRLLLIYTNVARMLLAVCFLLSRDHFVGLIAISIFFATASQFFGTTDAVTVPSVVPKDQLMSANSVFSMAVTGSQLIGMIFLAPILLPTIGAMWLFMIASLMFGVSVLCGCCSTMVGLKRAVALAISARPCPGAAGASRSNSPCRAASIAGRDRARRGGGLRRVLRLGRVSGAGAGRPARRMPAPSPEVSR